LAELHTLALLPISELSRHANGRSIDSKIVRFWPILDLQDAHGQCLLQPKFNRCQRLSRAVLYE
jgi:hypothetical protein